MISMNHDPMHAVLEQVHELALKIREKVAPTQNTFALTESAPGDFEPVQPFLLTGAWAILKTRKNLEQVQNCSCTDASFVLGDLKWCIQGLNQCKFPKNR
jgi:hypothetical protein